MSEKSERTTVQATGRSDTLQGSGGLSENRNKGVQVISGNIPADAVPPSTSMVTPAGPEAPPPASASGSSQSAE